MPAVRDQPRSHRRAVGAGGFTLVEAIATIVILAAVITVCSRIVSSATKGYTDSVTRAELHSQLSSAMDRIITDLRQTRVGPGSTPVAPDLQGATASSIGWTMVGGGTRSVALSGSQVTLTTESVAATALAVNITAFSVQCFDESNAALASTLNGSALNAVRRVRITLTGSSNGITETVRSKVFLRSMMTGAGS